MQLRQHWDRLFLPQLQSVGHGNVFPLSFHRKQRVDQRDRDFATLAWPTSRI